MSSFMLVFDVLRSCTFWSNSTRIAFSLSSGVSLNHSLCAPPSLGGRVKCWTPSSVRPSVCPSVSCHSKLESHRNFKLFQTWWRHDPVYEKLGEQVWHLNAKGQGHWERKCKIVFVHSFMKSGSIYIKLRPDRDKIIDLMCATARYNSFTFYTT